MIRTLRNALLLSLVSVIGLSGCAAAQTLTRPDPAGDYRLQFQDLDGTSRSMTLEASDLITPSLSVALTSSGASTVYTYGLSNASSGRARAERGVWLWKAACGQHGATVTTTAPAPWRSGARDLNDLKVCEFQLPTSAPLVDPGMSASGFTITSTALPAPGLVRIFGVADVPNWPVETDRIAPKVLAVADSVAGVSYFSYAGVELWTLLPLRSPESVATGPQATTALAGDLSLACGRLGWVSSRGVCNSLGVKLNAAKASFEHGEVTAAKEQLAAFVNELTAQRGKAVTDDAYTLFSTLANYTLNKF